MRDGRLLVDWEQIGAQQLSYAGALSGGRGPVDGARAIRAAKRTLDGVAGGKRLAPREADRQGSVRGGHLCFFDKAVRPVQSNLCPRGEFRRAVGPSMAYGTGQ